MDLIIDALASGDAQKISPPLTDFIQKNSQCFTFPELNENSTREALWKGLYNLGANPTQSALHRDCLSAVRILSRDKENLSDVINGDWVNILLLRSGLKDEENDGDSETAVEALKCLCNLIFNSRQVRALCCESNILDLVVKRASAYKEARRSVSMEIKFFDMKLLFLVTALCPKFRPKLKDDLHGFTLLTEILESVAKEKRSDHRPSLSDLHVDFCCEILKTLFNLCAGIGSRDDDDEGGDADTVEADAYLKLVSVLRDLLLVEAETKEKKLDLINHVVNLITIVPDDCIKMLIVANEEQSPKRMQFEGQDMSAIYEIVELLRSKFDSDMNVSSQNEMLSPILSALVKCVKANRAVRKYLRLQILPPLRDVHNRPEQGTTIRNCLCRLLTTPITQVRDFTADFLFVLCKENIGRMIKYTGYGNAAGMLANRGLLGGKNGDTWNYSSDSEDSETEEYLEHKHGINPVVGCYQPPRANPTASMTEEQKEYEAMKLVELMDNLTKKGIVKPCKVGPDGRPQPIEHILQLQEGIPDSLDEQDN